MENAYAPTILRQPPTTPFPDSPRSIDFSPFEFILAFLAVITIPALIYALFCGCAIKCPPRPYRRGNSYRSSGGESELNDVVKVVDPGLKYKKAAHVKDVGTDCPVCLSVFADGEEVKQLSACKHSFHASCINMWLKSHSNCPICRASVPVKLPINGGAATSQDRDGDLQQGFPDSASLV